nr:MAG TPA: 30S ribosomal protein S11 [Caudoviricetes sp.]
MAEYIEREKAKRLLHIEYAYAAEQLLDEIPAADVAPVVHGDWAPCFDEEHRWRQGWAQCSNCGRERYACTIRNVNYCPNCGAKMDGGTENG